MILKCFKLREYLIMIIAAGLIVGQVALELKLPDYMSDVTILVQTEGSEMSAILQAGASMLLCAFGSLILIVAFGFVSAQVAAALAMRLREQIYNKTMTFSLADKNVFSTGSLITRTTNDITQIQTAVAMGFLHIIKAPTTATWAITKISSKESAFTGTTVIALSTLLAVLATVLILTIPKSKIIQKLTDLLNTIVSEHLTGIRVVRAYNAEKYQEDKFEEANQKVTKNNIFLSKATSIMMPYMSFIMSVTTLAIYVVGAYLINGMADQGERLVLFSDMVVFSSYAIHVFMSFMMLTMTLLMLPRVIVSMNRIKEVLNHENAIKDGTIEADKSSKEGVAIEFKNVGFSYADTEELVLSNISFKAEKGETVAFIGSTGSGKTTLVNLIMRFYDCTSGEVIVNGKNVKEYTQSSLREKLGYVSQKANIFSGNVASNIAFGDENYSTDRINRAVDIAQAKDFVDKTGIDGEISQGGLNLSGGQKQRISIARAIYKDPEIFIFDDCFSALDYRTDKVLRKTLNTETVGKTKLMVAQRISTVKEANQIVVLDDGKVVGIGTHKELLKNCETYLDIAKSQLSKEELAYE